MSRSLSFVDGGWTEYDCQTSVIPEPDRGRERRFGWLFVCKTCSLDRYREMEYNRLC